MVYLAPGPGQAEGNEFAASQIDPRLAVKDAGADLSNASLAAWPYSDSIGPAERGCYLDWLASGRSDRRYGTGYVFFYFYGLEYRLFMDDSDDAERCLLVAEVERLRRIYGADQYIPLYLGKFLDVAHVILGTADRTKPSFEWSPGVWLSLSLKFSLGRRNPRRPAAEFRSDAPMVCYRVTIWLGGVAFMVL